eukprot:g6215.t1
MNLLGEELSQELENVIFNLASSEDFPTELAGNLQESFSQSGVSPPISSPSPPSTKSITFVENFKNTPYFGNFALPPTLVTKLSATSDSNSNSNGNETKMDEGKEEGFVMQKESYKESVTIDLRRRLAERESTISSLEKRLEKSYSSEETARKETFQARLESDTLSRKLDELSFEMDAIELRANKAKESEQRSITRVRELEAELRSKQTILVDKMHVEEKLRGVQENEKICLLELRHTKDMLATMKKKVEEERNQFQSDKNGFLLKETELRDLYEIERKNALEAQNESRVLQSSTTRLREENENYKDMNVKLQSELQQCKDEREALSSHYESRVSDLVHENEKNKEETRNFVKRCAVLESQVNDIKASLLTKNHQLQESENERDSLEKKCKNHITHIDSLVLKLQLYDDKELSFQEKIHKLEESKNELQKTNTNFRNLIEKNQNELKESKAFIEECNNQIFSLRQEVNKNVELLKATRDNLRLQVMKKNDFQKESDQSKIVIEKMKNQIDNLRSRLITSEVQNDDIANKLQNLEEERESLEKKILQQDRKGLLDIEKIKDKLHNEKSRADKLQSERDRFIENRNEMIEKINSMKRVANEEKELWKNEKRKFMKDVDKIATDIHNLRNEVEERTQIAERIRLDILNHKESASYSMKRSMNNVERNLEEAHDNVKTLKSDVKMKSKMLQVKNKETKKLSDELERIKAALNDSEKAEQKIWKVIKEIQNEAQRERREKEDALDEKRKLEMKIADAHDEMNHFKCTSNRLKKENNDFQKRIKATEEEKNKSIEENIKSKGEMERLKDKLFFQIEKNERFRDRVNRNDAIVMKELLLCEKNDLNLDLNLDKIEAELEMNTILKQNIFSSIHNEKQNTIKNRLNRELSEFENRLKESVIRENAISAEMVHFANEFEVEFERMECKYDGRPKEAQEVLFKAQNENSMLRKRLYEMKGALRLANDEIIRLQNKFNL